ncbi:MAG TPA: DUF417 family protein [Stellaceae bacterium]|nr:DUF417 family protein [Stellaceae bacterium]
MSQFTTKFDVTTGDSVGTRLPTGRRFMDSFARVLIRLGILKEDLDYHLIRASMVIIFLIYGYQKWFQYEADVLIPYISNGPLIFGCIRFLVSGEPPGFWGSRNGRSAPSCS